MRARLLLLSIALTSAGIGATPSSAGSACDLARVMAAKVVFEARRAERMSSPSDESNTAQEVAARDYIAEAAACSSPPRGPSAVGRGGPAGAEQRANGGDDYGQIDDGGVWFGVQPQHAQTGRKWGADSPYVAGTDVEGPRSSGGVVTYSFMADGVDLSPEAPPGPITNASIMSVVGYDDCWLVEIENAFAAWSAVADIQFKPVTDSGHDFDAPGAAGDIRIGFHPFDGAGGTVGHAFFPPPNGTTAAGDIHFDPDEPWFCDPTFGATDLGVVALHEIGHALGLDHEAEPPGGDQAIMNPFYDPALIFGPLPDDRDGVGEIYGERAAAANSFFGPVGVGVEQPVKSVDVVGDDDDGLLTNDTMVRVENESAVTTKRFLLQLVNAGAPGFSFDNSASSEGWQFSMDGLDRFVISRLGTGGQEVLIGKDGSVKIGPGGTNKFLLDATGNVTIAGGLTEASDAALKEDVEPADAVLPRLRTLLISEWSYLSHGSSRHVGPMAQDFHSTFGLGDDPTRISARDMAGVALAAIQELDAIVSARDTAIADQQVEIDELKQRLARIEAQLASDR